MIREGVGRDFQISPRIFSSVNLPVLIQERASRERRKGRADQTE
jgi:hypothetical protein